MLKSERIKRQEDLEKWIYSISEADVGILSDDEVLSKTENLTTIYMIISDINMLHFFR